MNDKEFLWGAGTSSYQVEGNTTGGGKGVTIWDVFNGGYESAKVASNSYFQYNEDIEILKTLGLKTYRFSISWARIYPNGKGKINQEGVDYYNNLLNLLLENNITPNVTLYHWDLPQALQEEYNGWLCKNNEIVEDFANYANICFKLFGDRVKYWSTINEPHTCAIDCYEYNWYAPGTGTDDGISPNGDEYLCMHNMLNAHAKTVYIYRKKYCKKLRWFKFKKLFSR